VLEVFQDFIKHGNNGPILRFNLALISETVAFYFLNSFALKPILPLALLPVPKVLKEVPKKKGTSK
jgi:hypothetical protein